MHNFARKLCWVLLNTRELSSSTEYTGTESLSEVDEQGRQSGAHPVPADCFLGGSFQELYVLPSLG